MTAGRLESDDAMALYSAYFHIVRETGALLDAIHQLAADGESSSADIALRPDKDGRQVSLADGVAARVVELFDYLHAGRLVDELAYRFQADLVSQPLEDLGYTIDYLSKEIGLGRFRDWKEAARQLDLAIAELRRGLACIERIRVVDDYLTHASAARLRDRVIELAIDGEAGPQPSASAKGADLPKPLTGKYAKALDYIKSRPNHKAIVIAKHIDVGEAHFRKVYLPELRKHGVCNDGDGYYWKPTGDSSDEAAPSAT